MPPQIMPQVMHLTATAPFTLSNLLQNCQQFGNMPVLSLVLVQSQFGNSCDHNYGGDNYPKIGG
jgi:hypothetical protein